MHLYEVRPRKDHRGVNLISDVLPLGRPWYGEPNAITNTVGYAQHAGQPPHADIPCFHHLRDREDPSEGALSRS
jgi:hypothetical protein